MSCFVIGFLKFVKRRYLLLIQPLTSVQVFIGIFMLTCNF